VGYRACVNKADFRSFCSRIFKKQFVKGRPTPTQTENKPDEKLYSLGRYSIWIWVYFFCFLYFSSIFLSSSRKFSSSFVLVDILIFEKFFRSRVSSAYELTCFWRLWFVGSNLVSSHFQYRWFVTSNKSSCPICRNHF